MNRGTTLAETLVAMAVLSIFAMGALSYLSASRDVAGRLSARLYESESLRLASDILASDIGNAGSGIELLDGDSFAPLVLSVAPVGHDWTESATVFLNNEGKSITLAAPIRAGDPIVAAQTARVEAGDRLLFRRPGAWEVIRIERVERHGGAAVVILRTAPREDYVHVDGVMVATYTYERSLRCLYRSASYGPRQPLLEDCVDFKIRATDDASGLPAFGRISGKALPRTAVSIELAAGSRRLAIGIPIFLRHLNSRFFARPGDVQG